MNNDRIDNLAVLVSAAEYAQRDFEAGGGTTKTMAENRRREAIAAVHKATPGMLEVVIAAIELSRWNSVRSDILNEAERGLDAAVTKFLAGGDA